MIGYYRTFGRPNGRQKLFRLFILKSRYLLNLKIIRYVQRKLDT